MGGVRNQRLLGKADRKKFESPFNGIFGFYLLSLFIASRLVADCYLSYGNTSF